MPLVNTGPMLGGMAIGAGRKLGGMVSHKLDGANQVHAIAIQGLFNAHAQQQAHEHHIATLREAHQMSGGGGFSVRTGEHETRIGKSKGGGKGGAGEGAIEPVTPNGGAGGGHDEAGRRTGPAEDHYENGRKFADGMHDRMRQIREQNSQGNAEQIREGSGTVRPMKELEAPKKALPVGSSGTKPATIREGGADRVTPGANVERVNGAIPIESGAGGGSKPAAKEPGMGMVDRTNAGKVNNRLNRFEERHLAERGKGASPVNSAEPTKIIDSKTPQEFMDKMDSNPQHFVNNASKRFDEIAARRQADGTAKFKA